MITRNKLVKRAHNILTEAMDKSMNAPIKRGYSALAGVQIPSISYSELDSKSIDKFIFNFKN